jgi:sodium/proline symporter
VAILGTIGWGFFVSANLPVFMIGMLWKRASREGVIVGLFLAIVCNILFPILENTGVYKMPMLSYMLSCVLSAGATVFVSLFTKGAAGENMPAQLKPIYRL